MRTCMKCGRQTDYYFWCNDCIDEFAPPDDKDYVHKMAALWEREEDAFVMANLFPRLKLRSN